MVLCAIPYADAPPIFAAQQYDSLNQKWEAIKSIIEQHDTGFALKTQQQLDTFRFSQLTGEDIEIFQEIGITIDEFTNSIKQINLNNRNKALEFKASQLKKVQPSIAGPLTDSPDTKFIITAKTLSGQIIPLECTGSMPIIEIKKILYDIIGDPPDQIRVIFKGKHLEDTSCVKDYGICLGDIIHIVLRLRGGMFHISTDAREDAVQCAEMNSVRINCRYYERGIWSLNYPPNFTSVELRAEIVKTAIKEHIKLPIHFAIDVTNMDGITHRFLRDDTSIYLGKMKSVTIN